MLLRAPNPHVAFCALTALVLAYSIFWWSVAEYKAYFDLSDCIAALRLIWCSLILILIGHAVMALFVRCCSRVAREEITYGESALRLLPFLSRSILALCVGQVATMAWVLTRSGLSGIAYYLTARQLPISWIEVCALVIGAVVVAPKATREPRSHFNAWQVGGLLVVLACVVTPLAVRDLPRTVALSSDPDQHAFWASQVYKLGIVPWNQGLTGVGPFGYPAGFAVLNAIWMTFSGLSAVEIVTIQPMLQFLLAVLICTALSPLLAKKYHVRSLYQASLATNWVIFFIIICALVAYWIILPYGLQRTRVNGEGSARLSTSMFSAIAALLWIVQPSVYSRNVLRWLVPLISTMTLVLVATINPLSVVAPAVILCPWALYHLWCILRSRAITGALLPVSLAGVLGCIMIVGEPYLLVSALNYLRTPSASDLVTYSSIKLPGWSLSLSPSSIVAALFPQRLSSMLFIDTVSGALPTIAVSAACIVWAIPTPAATVRWIIAVALCSLTCAVAHSAALSGVAAEAQRSLPWYLAMPYIYESALQVSAVLGFILLGVSLYIVQLWFAKQSCRALLLVLLLGVAFLPLNYVQLERSAAFDLTPRECRAESTACLTDADRDTLYSLSRYTKQIRARYPQLTYYTAPKVLILGTPMRQGVERWVFPSGVSRIVPLYSYLPVAFFYGRGHSDWSYDNYLSRVCRKLDSTWLKERNVRFLFLGRREPGCMKRRREVIQRSTILYERDGTRLLELDLP
jgi:hypothetical protein